MSDAVPLQSPPSTEAELIAVRREKLVKLRELGVDPFGARFEVSVTPAALHADFAEGLRILHEGGQADA